MTIKIWSPYIPLQKNYLSQEDSPFHAGLNENTGIDVRWEWPAPGADGNQAYNTMLASQDLPDIIYVWDNFNEGPKLLDDGIIITLDDVLPDYAPNYWNYLQNNPAVDRAVKTDDGNYFTFQSLREDPWLCTYTGPVVRKDWLDEQSLGMPTTIDEVENVLKVFNEKYGAKFGARPHRFKNISTLFAGAYGIDPNGYFVDSEKKVQYGPVQPEYKEYLKLLNRWYEEGLLDPDFASLDDTIVSTKMLNNEIGYTVTAMGQLTNWIASNEAAGGTAEFVGAPYPGLEKGKTPPMIQTENMPFGPGAMITTACENVDIAVRFCDYGYSEEGIFYWNYGSEDDTYTLVDGVPTFTDKILKDPEGLNEAVRKYTGNYGNGLSIQTRGHVQQKNSPEASQAVDVWLGDIDPYVHWLPQITPTTAEAKEAAEFTGFEAFKDEMYWKFILGEEDIDAKWDEYVTTITETMGQSRVLELKQIQYDRFMNR